MASKRKSTEKAKSSAKPKATGTGAAQARKDRREGEPVRSGHDRDRDLPRRKRR